jgi:hypothetical protein
VEFRTAGGSLEDFFLRTPFLSNVPSLFFVASKSAFGLSDNYYIFKEL